MTCASCRRRVILRGFAVLYATLTMMFGAGAVIYVAMKVAYDL